MRRTLLVAALSTLTSAPLLAGGAWVPQPGSGWLQLGASRKTAQQTWSSRGTTNFNAADHDFRYAYLSGETGLWKGLAANWNLTYLDGYEGRPDSQSEEHTSELQSRLQLVCRPLLVYKNYG